MRLSFVVPACLDSILTQTRNLAIPAEIIVVNNASTDRTRSIVFAYPEVTLVDEPRKGLTHARQAGCNACSGDSKLHRSFNVVRANSAKTKAIIQKRAITLDSLQPNNSKW